MRRKYLGIAVLSTVLLLASCGSKSSSQGGQSTLNTSMDSQVTSSQVTTSNSLPIDDEYVVLIQNSSSLVEITSDKAKAKEGELITLTVKLNQDVVLTKIMINGTIEATKVNDLTYTFTMPNRDAIVKPVLSVNADVALVGDVTAVLQEENGVYVAHNVEIKTDSHVSYAIKNAQGEVEELSIVALDNHKCNADIDITKEEYGFTIAGNAKYDFYYDPTDKETPCYVQRVELLSEPKTVRDFESLFAGKVRSEPATYPEGLNYVHYTSTKSNDDYTWNLYDNASLARVNKLGTSEETGLVYTNLNNGVLTVVDTYIEGDFDDSKVEDKTLYSAKYKIVDEVQSGYKKYQKTLEDGINIANAYSHDVYSFDRNIHLGYRTGFDTSWNDNLAAANVDYKVEANEKGYKVTINSYKTTKTSTDTNGNTAGKQEHIEYEIVVDLNKAGNILTASYLETHYDSTAYDFSKLEFLTGGKLQGVVAEEMHLEYGYGEKNNSKPSFDYRPYFVSEIVSAKVVNEKMEKENQLTLEDVVEEHLKLEVLPATALDVNQYGVISSSNENVIRPSRVDSPFDLRVYGTGTTTLTVGNHVDNMVKKQFDVEVPSNIAIREFYMQNTDGDFDNILAKEATIKANTVREVYCYAHQYPTIEFAFTPVSSNESLLKVSRKGQILVLDTTGAKDITSTQVVTVTINCDLYEAEAKPTTFTIKIQPNKGTTEDFFVGTWVGTDKEHNNQTVTMTLNAGGTGRIVASSKASAGFAITYNYNAALNQLTIIGPDYSYNFVVKFDDQTQTIGIIAWTYAWGDEYENEVIGYYLADEEGYELEVSYCTLSKQN